MTTVRAINAGELTLLRTEGQFSKLYLAVYKPNTIYTARLAALPSSNDKVAEITYNTGSGTLGDVVAEMTLWVGSSAGARDLGVCRIRKAPISGTFYIGMTSEIEWQSSCYLTVVDMFSFSARVPRMDSGTYKLDYETTYSDQHTSFQPVPIMGTHAVLWLTGASVSCSFDSSDSWVLGSSISSRSWTAPGASGTSGMTTNTPTITYNAAGYYRVYCVVTAANGKSYTGIRHVFVFDTNNLPYQPEITKAISGDYSGGGWSFGVKCYADTSAIVDGTLAVLFAKDWYGDTEQSIGQITGRENIICVGYVDGESIEWDSQASNVSFNVNGANEILGGIEINPFVLNIALNTPAAWETMPALTADRALWHLLHWRTNVTALLDVYKSDDTRCAEIYETAEGSVWNSIATIGQRIFANGGVDKYGRFFFAVEPQLVPEADRTWATVMDITKVDWQDTIQIERATKNSLAMASLSGQYTGSLGGTNIYYSLSFGNVKGRNGGTETIDQILTGSQDDLNELAGLYTGWKNLEYEFSITLPQNNRMIDVFPNQFLSLTMATGDTPRGIAYLGNLIPRSVELSFNVNTGAITTDIQCDEETFEQLNMNGNVPTETGANDWDDSTFPGIDMPDFTAEDFLILPPDITNNNQPKVVVIAGSKGVFYTDDFDASTPTWKAMNNGLDSTAIAAASKELVATPSGALWMITQLSAVSDNPAQFDNNLYYTAGIGGEWKLVYNADELGTALGGDRGSFLGIGVNPNESDSVGLYYLSQLGAFGTENFRMLFGSGGTLGFGAVNGSLGSKRHKGVIHRDDGWRIFTDYTSADVYMLKMSSDGDIDIAIFLYAAASANISAVKSGEKYIQWDDNTSSPSIRIVADDGTFDEISTGPIPPDDEFQGVVMSPTGINGMGGNSTPYKTTDSGASWQSVGGVIPVGSDVWESCGDNNRFIFGGGTTLRLTMDQGATYVEKSGNLTYVAASIDITAIRFIS